jgi:two-component system response regulator HydG
MVGMSALRELIEGASQHEPLVAVVAGSGLVTRCAVEAGAQLLLALSAGVYRTFGVGSLGAFMPFGNANQQTEQLLKEHLLPQRRGTPIVAGLYAADIEQDVRGYLRRWKQWGVEGIVNWPAVGFVDGQFRECLEAAGAGTAAEVAMLGWARDAGLVTFGFALSPAEVRQFTEAGVDGLILNLGLTQELEDVLERRDRIQQSVARLNEMLALACASARPPLCLAFGGPVTTAEDLQVLIRQSDVRGFAGGSVFERLPVEAAITSTIRRFRGSLTCVDHERQAQGFGPLIGRSPAMCELYDLIRRVATQNISVCIEGETGTGKELIATQIHRLSRRSGQPMITLNCGAIPDSLLESELFGHEKGAFTSADRRRRGKFELASKGTLFLDEIADLSPRGQVALLRAIQQQEITPVGADTPIPVDVRILGASNRPLRDEVAAGRFREDLFYRLSQITLRVPPLRDRPEDLPLLVQEILGRLQVDEGIRTFEVSARFLGKLSQHAWPGNVRELEAVLREAAIRENASLLEGRNFFPSSFRQPVLPADATSSAFSSASGAAHAVPLSGEGVSFSGRSRSQADSRKYHRTVAEQAVQTCGGNKALAAKQLGVSRKTLYAWLKHAP